MQIAIVIGIPFLLVSSAFGQADSARFISPFEGMTSTRLSVVIGGPLDIEGGPMLRLFAGDAERAARFQSAVTQALADKLEVCRISLDQNVDDEIALRVFGRPAAEESCVLQTIYLVEIEVFNSRQVNAERDPRFSSLRPVIGLANDDALEAVLIKTAVAILSAELGDCQPPLRPANPR